MSMMEQAVHNKDIHVRHAAKLASLSAWSSQHVGCIFETRTDEDSLQAIDATFSKNLTASINGAPLNRDGLKQLVLTMRHSSARGLNVEWKQALDVAKDPSTNREGVFGGFYVIKGLRKRLPGSDMLAEFERHKTVTVRIESESSDPSVDSRKITHLVFVAIDVPAQPRAHL
ncbi:hypothetical protein SERLADRAFT_491638 [Serpula lacrymans var. lacrymans S7.9]|uniref:Uncharacterized protein n=1 Tax=Serpula lacrymans var. lacrymans (strain S7.9) TaxID=578457 RepID=F8NWR8_SERL9|nr:uncharacterized protein SERLADRAFT_491638 [Serpula lacrymans var. lacrymans S7.9]EGO25080.1 hypothetical protein SERLADRAFT_491638 [Serpula lacrymans var. lacrymans S7.9]